MLSMMDFDERYLDITPDNVLRIPGILMLGWCVMARHWMIFLCGLVSILISANEASQLAISSISWVAMALELPVVILIIAASRRNPSAPGWVKYVWRRGSQLMLSTQLLGLAWLTVWLYQAEVWQRWPELFFVSCALLDLAIALGVHSSAYLRQVFSEFPTRTGRP
jgi:hypothetical protein